MEFENWKIEKGVYNPPAFDNVYHRKIKISPYIHSKIQHIIGKDGKNFIDITQQFNLLYVYYIDNHIELYGLNSRKVHEAIHYIIYQIKKYNLMRYKESNENEQEVDNIKLMAKRLELSEREIKSYYEHIKHRHSTSSPSQT